MKKSKPFRLKVYGENACFTRPEMKVERVSYDVMTPSAARGILESILWKPAIQWTILQIDVLNPIQWTSLRRNEIGSVISSQNIKTAMKKSMGRLGMYIENERQQRAALLLKKVAYIIHSEFELTEKTGPDDSISKFEHMFIRRARKGQCYHRPYFGCREFPVCFEFIDRNEDEFMTINETRDLGWMLYDFDYSGKEPMPMFFNAKLDKGKIDLRNVEVRK
jgi:CRISPR-associated protein Cas5d